MNSNNMNYNNNYHQNPHPNEGNYQRPPQGMNNANPQQDDFFKFHQFDFPDMEQFNDDEDMFFGRGRGQGGNPIDYMMDRMQLPVREMQNAMNQMEGNLNNFGGFLGEENNMVQPNQNNQPMVRGNSGPNYQNLQMNQRGAQHGTILSKTYVSSTKFGKDGKPEKEVYQSQAINQIGDDGHKISERQEAYKNSLSGVEKAAHQRMLDDRGHKLVKERNRNTGDQNEHNLYKGMQEDQLNNFNNDFNNYKQKVGFDKNYPLLQKMNVKDGLRQIGAGYNNYNYNNNRMIGNNNYGNQNQRNNYNQPRGYLGNGENNYGK